MRYGWLVVAVLMLFVGVGVVFGEFVNSRNLTAVWEAPDEQDVIGFDLRLQVGIAEPETMRVECGHFEGACSGGYVVPGDTYGVAFVAGSDGPLTAMVRAVDKARNVSDWDSTGVEIDTAPPGGCSGIRVQGR